jgi:hypothetical protein
MIAPPRIGGGEIDGEQARRSGDGPDGDGVSVGVGVSNERQ